MSTLIKNHNVILVDCDFDTPYSYFEVAQEIYLVQSMDILTIQPLTYFLKELKNIGVDLDKKVRINWDDCDKEWLEICDKIKDFAKAKRG